MKHGSAPDLQARYCAFIGTFYSGPPNRRFAKNRSFLPLHRNGGEGWGEGVTTLRSCHVIG